MTDILPRPKRAPQAAAAKAAPPARRVVDCEVLIIGGGLAASALAHRLAGLGRQVVRIPVAEDKGLPRDGALSPGFGLPAVDLVERIGRGAAAELWRLSRQAAERGRTLAQELGLDLGPKGTLLVARPGDEARLFAEHDLLEELAPGAARFVPARDLDGLLASRAFAGALGLVPAVRMRAADLAGALGALEEQAGIRTLTARGPVSCDLNGLRKYVDVGSERVRAFEVILCGTAALKAGAPHLARSLAFVPFAAGHVALAGGPPAFAGRVEAFGGHALSFHGAEDGLRLAAQAPLPVWGGWAARQVLRGEARGLFPGGVAGAVSDARGCAVARTAHLMPLAGAVGKGVWVAGAFGLQPLPVQLLVADLIAEAVALKDDRIALLAPFLEVEPRGLLGAARDFASYWRVRLPGRLAPSPPDGSQGTAQGPAAEGEGLTGGPGARLPEMRPGGRAKGRPISGAVRPVPENPRSGARRSPKDGA